LREKRIMKGKPNLLYKTLVVGVIVLFVGMGIQPAFAQIQQDNSEIEYYDVNIEICGLGKDYTIQLSKQQLNEIDLLFESLKGDLDNSKSEEEIVNLYNRAIKDLDGYGLLGDYSVKQVKKLITGNYIKNRNSNLLNKLNNYQSLDTNVFCLISGDTDNTYFIPPISMLFHRLNLLIFITEFGIFGALALLRYMFGTPFPLKLGNGIAFGYQCSFSYRNYPANGWIRIQDSNDITKWDDDIYGQISEFDTIIYPLFVYVGVIGFVGIKISKEIFGSEGYYYLGFANYISLGSEVP
jgi:hypothetical protein